MVQPRFRYTNLYFSDTEDDADNIALWESQTAAELNALTITSGDLDAPTGADDLAMNDWVDYCTEFMIEVSRNEIDYTSLGSQDQQIVAGKGKSVITANFIWDDGADKPAEIMTDAPGMRVLRATRNGKTLTAVGRVLEVKFGSNKNGTIEMETKFLVSGQEMPRWTV